MKRYIIPLLILFPLIISSCVKDLKEEPKGILNPGALFSNSNGITMAANNLGAQLAGIVYNSCWHMLPYMGGDDLIAISDPDLREVDVFNASDGNQGLLNDWGGYYSTIRAANIIISNVNLSVADQSVNDDCLGQAYFYRALSYSFLTRIWGKVPLIDKYSSEIDYTIKSAEVADIYSLIVSDCLKADSLLPETRFDGSYPGAKPIKGTAKALLSQVYLTMSGWPLKQSANYALAAAKAKEVIDNASTYGYELADINKLWTWAYNYENKECIFGVYYNNTSEGGNAGTMASPPADRPGEEGGWAEYEADISFFKKFPAGPRKNVTFQTTIQINGDTIVSWDDALTQHKHPYYQKYTDDRDKYDWWGSRTQQVIRYAEVLLTYAEAQAMSAGPDVSAYDAVNQVRRRAGLPELTPGLSANDFRDSVVAERGWEFAGGEPASRWFDLLRLERVEEATLERDPSELPLKTTPSKDSYWMPIPALEKALDPNLK
jgi:starch-binding outer membrane protein, SusD/RagB family